MANCIGIDFENHGYKLQHIVSDTKGNSKIRTSDVLFWVVLDTDTEILHIPISRYDMKTNTRLTSPQLVKFFSDCDRRLVRKDLDGATILQCGGISKDT